MASSDKEETDAEAQKRKADQAKKDQEEAAKQLNAMFAQSRPKNLREGTASGVSNIVGGAVGAVGVAVLVPTLGLGVGLKNGGIVGGVIGVTGGAVIGVVGAAALAIGGVVSGVMQLGRGVAAVPQAITAPRQGKWWCEAEGKWVLTNLPEEYERIQGAPKDDSDLLGEIEAKLDLNASTCGGTVLDPFYYDVLEVDPKAEPSAIKRKYYVLARKYHPDKVGTDDKEAADKFKDCAEAYQVLSDPELRAKYDKEGREGLSADRTTVATDTPKMDPAILFAFLFGSDRFDGYLGRLSMATSASVGDSPKVSMDVARTIQKRRVTRLAFNLAEKLQPWTQDEFELCKTLWETETTDLSTASYGLQLVHTIGKIYSLSAVQFVGSMDSGVGLPSVSKWASANKAAMKESSDANKYKMDTLRAGMEMMSVQQKFAKEMEAAKTEEEKKAVQAKMEEASGDTLLKILWTTTVVDITAAIHEAAQMLLFDKSVDTETRLKRAHGLKALGQVFMDCPAPEKSSDEEKSAAKQYEEAAFAAMVETIKRKEEAAFASG